MADHDDHICGGIEYMNPDGIPVHSDMCIDRTPPTFNQRQLLHAVLDEWLNLSSGTGIFWIGDPSLLYPDPEDNPTVEQLSLFPAGGSHE